MSPILVHEIPDPPTPREALGLLAGLPGRALLESAGSGGRFSLLAALPRKALSGEGDPLEAIAEALRWVGGGGGSESAPPGGRSSGSHELPFAGGLVGFLSYEAGDALERLPPPPPDDVGIPLLHFGVYEWAVLWDWDEGGCRIAGTLLPGRAAAELSAGMELVRRSLVERTPIGVDAPLATAARAASPPTGEPFAPSSLSRERFETGVDRIREYIRAGDLFQANLTRRISLPLPRNAEWSSSTTTAGRPGEALFHHLMRESPAPYAAYLDLGALEVASISPEAFLSGRDGVVETRPIKGTAPRGESEEADRRLRDALLASEKDRAENVMIVDLLRSDLSRVCEPDSVEVPALLAVESHPTVHHLVSTVRGRLRPGVGPVELLRATFPGGSITGAPKIRAQEILRELEPVRRGVYTGALGVIGFDGAVELSIPIRTAVVRDGWAHYGTGGGITLASDPSAEWDETEAKAAAFRRALSFEGVVR